MENIEDNSSAACCCRSEGGGVKPLKQTWGLRAEGKRKLVWGAITLWVREFWI